MKSTLHVLAGALALALTGIAPAVAADMPLKAPAAVIVSSWTGLYVGGHIGYVWNDTQYRFADPNNAAFNNCGPCAIGFGPNAIDNKTSGVIAGVHLGYNWQFNSSWLVGVEGDVDWSGRTSSSNTPLTSSSLVGGGGPVFSVPGSNLNLQTKINWLASARGRLGYIHGDWMAYATGGAAWLGYDFTGSASCPAVARACDNGGGAIASNTAFGATRTGWVAGGGVEWQAPASPWRARVEYLYYRFDRTDTGSAAWIVPGGPPATCLIAGPCNGVFSVGNINIQTVRVGLSYAFR